MKHWTYNKLIESVGGHISSEKHSRIQVVKVEGSVNRKLFPIEFGEVLITVLAGQGKILTQNETISIEDRSQTLLTEGEAFKIEPSAKHDLIVQFVWMPGPY